MPPDLLTSVLVKPDGPDCNMACDYCFYLDKAELFQGASHRMSDDVQRALVRETMRAAGKQVIFVWQGGEPTLMGHRFFERAVELQMKFGRGQTVGNALQTNGLLLDDRWLQLFRRYRFLIGISLDGPEQVHDHHRRRLGGQGSHARAVAATRRLLEAGISTNSLSVVTDHSVKFPRQIYSHLRSLGLTHLQFIPCVEPSERRPDPAAYGDFLCQVFDLWCKDFRKGLPTATVRNFESVLHLYAGYPAPECTLMDSCGVYLVVEHDGGVYPCDFYVEPQWRLGDVTRDSLGDLLNSDRQRGFGQLKTQLCRRCQACPWLAYCRGGCTHHRPAPGELNLFCDAFKALFHHASPRMKRMVAQLDKENTPVQATGKTGRNDLCPCGSGKKFKRCCR